MPKAALRTGNVPLVALVPLRVLTGLIFLRIGVEKIQTGFIANHSLSKYVEGALAEGSPFLFYARFLRQVVLPNAKLFSYLVVGGEIAIGAALTLGLLSRPTAFFGLAMMLGFSFAQGILIGAANTVAFTLIFLTLLFAPTGRVMGVDAKLQGRLPSWLV